MALTRDIDDREYQKFVDAGTFKTAVRTTSDMELPYYDYISLVYTGSTLTSIEFKVGGVAGTVVATLTLDSSGSVLTGVGRT